MRTFDSAYWPDENVEIGEEFDDDDDLTFSLTDTGVSGRATTCLARDDVRALRDHLTEVLGEGQDVKSPTFERGQVVRLLPDAKTAGGGEVYFADDVTLVKVVSGPGATGSYLVENVDGSGAEFGSGTATQYVGPDYLAAIDETPDAEEIGEAVAALDPKAPIIVKADEADLLPKVVLSVNAQARVEALKAAKGILSRTALMGPGAVSADDLIDVAEYIMGGEG